MTDLTPPPQVWPTLRARDALGLIRFLVEAFGFEETVVYADGDQWPVKPGSFGAYVVTGQPDELFARAAAAGAQVLMDLHETDYGSRDFAVRDPEGNRWSFGTYRGEPRKGDGNH
jgi:uncharacterized glyoxalase superfamily protein PhnB